MGPKSSPGALHDTLTTSTLFFMVPIIFYTNSTPKTSIAKSYDDPGDDFLGLLCVLLPLNYKLMQLSDHKGRFKVLDIRYMENGAIVVIAYVFLLKINLQYYILAPFPICLVAFIIHLSNEMQQHVSGSEDKDGNKKSEELVAAGDPSRSDVGLEAESMQIGELEWSVEIPFFMLLIIATCGGSSPVPSHFLLFSCCALGTLALLYSRLLADEVTSAPALKPALECIQMSYMVMLFITAHTVAAEWLGEVTALVSMPELIAGLLWFSSLLQRGHFNGDSDHATSDNYCFFIAIPLGAVLAGLICTYGYDEGGLTKATIACAIAGFMPYLSVWMIPRWPGGIPASNKATQLLKFLANICLTGACLMLPALLAEKTRAYLIGPSVLKYLPGFYFTTGVAWLVALFVTHLARA